MAVFKAFKAVRPHKEAAAQVAALPYDVYNREEAKAAVEGKPLSFLNIDRPETQYGPDFDMYSKDAYDTAKSMIEKEIAEGTFIEDPDEAYYIYELTMDGRVQTGFVGLSSIDDYETSVIKKHENTLAAKEQDRINHIKVTGYQTGPIFLAYRKNERLSQILEEVKKTEALYDFTSEDGITHRVWKIDKSYSGEIESIFAGIKNTYIADGHHRAASAVRVGAKDGGFLSVLFADDELKILPYNRAVKSLNGMTAQQFFTRLEEIYDTEKSEEAVTPSKKGEMGLYLPSENAMGGWYKLTLKPAYASDDPVYGLDVSVLQNKVLSPMLDINDPKTDKRISFIGGIRGNKELERLVEQEGYAAAMSMYPTQLEELMAVADAGRLMPPKSTWFEPKLRSGLFLHRIG